jgi:hypothetical protein
VASTRTPRRCPTSGAIGCWTAASCAGQPAREDARAGRAGPAHGKVGQLERALGRRTYEPEVAGEPSQGWGERARRPVPRRGRCGLPAGAGGARCRGLPASPVPAPEPPAWGGWTGAHRPGRPGHRQRGQGQVRPTAPAWWRRWLVASSAGPVNCKRVQRAMRTHRLLQPSRSTSPGPGFRVTRPDELWHLDVTKPWTAPARLGSTCRRSSTAPPGRSPADRLRCTATGDEAIACAEAAVLGAPSLLEG